MNISIKNKFSVIIVFMSILSLLFAYIISNEFISKNLRDKEILRENEKVLLVEREIRSIETSILSDLNLYSKSKLVQDFYLEFNKKSNFSNSFDISKNVNRKLSEYFAGNYPFMDTLHFVFINQEGQVIDRENTISQTSEEVKRIIKYNEVAYGNYLYYWNDENLNYIATVPLIEEYTNKARGVLVLNFIVGKSFFNRLSSKAGVDFLLYKNTEIMKSTLFFDESKSFKKGNILEVKNKMYKLNRVSMPKNVDEFYIAFDKNESIKERSELSSYLFIALFFVFTLLFIVASTVLNIFVDSLRRLTLKINSLKDGNFNVNLGNLKNSNDEIGILAHDFEMMVHILKGKIKELEEANDNNRHYSARLEKANSELKESQKSINEKSENIDRINKLLNSRITEISNIYYLMMNISKYLIDDKFYDIILKGIREGLVINKVALYTKHGDNLVLKRSLGFEKNSELINIEGVDQLLFKKDIINGEELLGEKDFGNVENTYIFPLIASRSEEQLYGVILISNGEKIKQEFKKSILTYIKVIIMAIENRKLYIKLLEDNKKLEETTRELQESEKMKNIFISNISHELRVPLVPIKGYHEIILEEHMGELNFKQKKALRTSLKNIERLQEIIENILNYSRIESGKYQILNTRVKVEEVIEDALLRLENIIEGKKVEIIKKYTDNGAYIMIDREALKQIFINLISNAIKFSKDSTVSMSLSVEENGDRYKIIIKDNGVGMDRSKIDLVLQSFRQMEEGDTRKYSGIGLGLTVVEKILDYYGEKIHINSHLNRGTEVYFYFKKG